MRVFLSWSGDESRQVAAALRDWLPSVIQSIEPWMSNEDIAAGTRWFEVISKELDKASTGVICLTPTNLDRPWLNFEAGAIAKRVSESFACPYLFRLKPSQLKGPLNLFHVVTADKDGTRKLLRALNGIEHPLEERRLDEAIDTWWPKLEERLGAIPSVGAPPPPREVRDMVEEVLLHVRKLASTQQIQDSAQALLRGLGYAATSAEWRRHWSTAANSENRPLTLKDKVASVAVQREIESFVERMQHLAAREESGAGQVGPPSATPEASADTDEK